MAGAEDLSIGGDTFSVTLPDGTTVTTYHKIGSHTFLDGIRNAIQNGCVGNGTADDRAALNTLANTTLSGGGVIFFPSGYTFRISSALTFPSNVTLLFGQGAKLSVDTGITVTIAGPVNAVPGSILFTGIGTVSCTAAFPAVTSVSWWDSGAGTLGFTSNYYGNYTPTLTNTSNVAASTAYPGEWTRIGKIINVSWEVDITPTAAAPTATELQLSLPVVSDFTTTGNAKGIGGCINVPAQTSVIDANTPNNRLSLNFTATSTALQRHRGLAMYEVV